MHASIESLTGFVQDFNLVALFFDAALKSFFVLAIALAICRFWRRVSAAARHLIWFFAMGSLVVLPFLSAMLPTWKTPIWSLSTGIEPGNQFSMALEWGVPVKSTPQKLEVEESTVLADQSSAKAQGGIGVGFASGWLGLIFLIWPIGFAFALWRLTRGHWLTINLARGSQRLGTEDWLGLLQNCCDLLRVRRHVTLLISKDDVIPLTWGGWRPVVLLPAEARTWPVERRRLVLMHELAHVRRWDWLTQVLCRIICAVYWFNPLVWLAAREMCAERECACDDLVLNAGCKPSDYAMELVEIARRLGRRPGVGAVAMARSSRLESRVAAIVDVSRARQIRPRTICALALGAAGLIFSQGGCKTHHRGVLGKDDALRQKQIARLKTFSAAKEKQSRSYAADDGDRYFADFENFFHAAVNGNGKVVTNMYANFKKRHGQYENSRGDLPHTSYWSPVLEVGLAYYEIMAGEPKYEQLAIDGIIKSISPGSIFFGGTDPGRGLPTAFSKSHIDGDPFFTLTQNALADATYLDYLRRMYGGKIYTPTDEDSKSAFEDYRADAERRRKENKLKPGENVKMVDGKTEVTGQVAVMEINARLAKIIFDKNPRHDFYLEESFPLDWMYPHLSPNGLILKINREPLPSLSEETLKRDREYWGGLVREMVGDWLEEDTSVKTITEFSEKVFGQRNLQGFRADVRFIQSQHAQKLFSKFRSAIGGVYAWRVSEAAAKPDEQKRMMKEADLAFRQAFVLCPYSPEAIFRYANLLVSAGRVDDAFAIADTARKLEPSNKSIQNLVRELTKIKSQRAN